MHGQILGTHSFYLKEGFPVPDEYSEIEKKYFLPGGETGTAATVLASLGASVKIDGTHMGHEVWPMLKKFYEGKSVDLSSLKVDENYEGLMDYVLISGFDRTPMGTFQHLYQEGIKRWNMPNEKDIVEADVVGIDPFFQEETQECAELCIKHKKKFVTIDCPHDSFLHKNCDVNIVSKECLGLHYKNMGKEKVFELLKESTDGLTIITSGASEILYGRKGENVKKLKPFKVDVKSTLGAGDTFKAGCLYALLHGMDDDYLVRFASACSAIAISRFPLPLNPPRLDEVNDLLSEGKNL